MSGVVFHRGDRVVKGNSSTVLLVAKVEKKRDSAGGEYDVAHLTTLAGRPVDGPVETTRLRHQIVRGKR